MGGGGYRSEGALQAGNGGAHKILVFTLSQGAETNAHDTLN